MVDAFLFLNIFSGFALIGLILTIHFVHYPSFRFISTSKFVEFHRFHSIQMTKIVLPLMLIELISSLYFSFNHWNVTWTVNLALVFGIWGVTFFWSVPCHSDLEQEFDEDVFNSLVRSNLLRTLLWTFRAIIISTIIWEKL